MLILIRLKSHHFQELKGGKRRNYEWETEERDGVHYNRLKRVFKYFNLKELFGLVANFVMHPSTIFRDCHPFFSGGSTLHCFDQIFDQEELLHLEQRLLHQFPLALVIPPAASPPRLPRGLRLLLHHLRPHTNP